MRDVFVLIVHFVTTVIRLAKPGGLQAVVAESVLAKHQLLIVNRSRRRAPNLRIRDRLIAGFCSLWIKPSRFRRVAILFNPSTLLSFHRALVQRKYRLLFSAKQRTKPGPKGPTADLIRAVVEMKKRNPSWGYPQIADQINLAFGTAINKDVVRRILALHYQPAPQQLKVPSSRGETARKHKDRRGETPIRVIGRYAGSTQMGSTSRIALPNAAVFIHSIYCRRQIPPCRSR